MFLYKLSQGAIMFYIDGTKIRDELGRERIFRGANFCFKITTMDIFEKRAKKVYHFVDALARAMEQNGANLIRLGFTWSMLEPVENEYDDRAFKLLKDTVAMCQERGIYVFLDCHQDLFYNNKGIGDGAPEWLTKDYKKQRPLAIWAEGYFYMQDIQRAFNDFWDNKNGMQDKFVKLWKKVIAELGEYDNIIAYDYLNEPMIYGNSNDVFCALIDGACKEGLGIDFNAKRYYQNGNEKSGFAKMALALYKEIRTVSRLKTFLNNLDDYNAFSKVVSSCEKYIDGFDKKYYQPFFDKMVDSCGDDKHFNFFEHSYYSNLGLPFSINSGKNGIYSPHAYDVFIDSPLYNAYSSNDRIKYILDNIRKNQENMNVPVVMGEWGGGANNGNEWIKHIDYIYSVLEQNHWSNIYWAYRFKNKDFVNMINRPYPVAVCGDIISYKTDSKLRTFELTYDCKDNNAKTLVYVTGKGVVEFDNKIGINRIELKY